MAAISLKGKYMISEKERRAVWLKQTPESRALLITGVIDALIDVEDISLEQAIQRVMDTYQCEHQEVIEALANQREEVTE